MALEIYDGLTWTKLVNSNDLQASIILPVIAAGTNNATSTFTQVDGISISSGQMFLLISQISSNQNGIYLRNSDNSNTRINTQPLGAYVLQGNTKANKLFFSSNNSQTWTQLIMSSESISKINKKVK